MGSTSEASPSGFFPATSQTNLHTLGQINIVGNNRGLNIHDMALDQPNSQYEDQKKAKLEVNMGFTSSSSNGAVAEGAAETFTNQSEQAHASASASNWHQAHHHAQAYTNAQYPTGYFSQVMSLLCLGNGLYQIVVHHFCLHIVNEQHGCSILLIISLHM